MRMSALEAAWRTQRESMTRTPVRESTTTSGTVALGLSRDSPCAGDGFRLPEWRKRRKVSFFEGVVVPASEEVGESEVVAGGRRQRRWKGQEEGPGHDDAPALGTIGPGPGERRR